MKAGINLFGVHNLMQDDSSYMDTLKKLKQMGYSYFQHSGSAINFNLLKRAKEELDFSCVLTHAPLEAFTNDLNALIKNHKEVNCYNIGIGGISSKLNEEGFIEDVEKLKIASNIIAGEGLKFFYHFHHFEFAKLKNGQLKLDYLIENCPNFNFTFDTYWAQYGGVDVLEYLEKLKGKIECVHLKDYQILYSEEKGFYPDFAPVGCGNLNLKKIIAKMKDCGAKYFLVEQDNARNFASPLEQVKKSIDYLKDI